MASPTFSDTFITTTSFAALEKFARDMVHGSQRAFTDLEKMGKISNQDGGHQVTVTWVIGNHSTTTQLSTGYEPLNLDATRVLKPGFDTWYYGQRPIIISQKDEDINSGRAQMISLIDVLTKETHLAYRAQFEQQTLQGNVALLSDLNTWNGFDFTTGFLEATAVGSQTNTLHGVARTAFQTLPHFQNQRADHGGSFSANALRDWDSAGVDIDDITAQSMESKKRMYLSKAGIKNYKRAVGTAEVYQHSSSGAPELNAGRRPAAFGDYDIVVTSVLPNSGDTTTGSPWTAVMVDYADIGFTTMKNKWFAQSKFERISGHDVRAAFISTFCQNVCPGLGRHFVGYDGETF